MKVAACTVYGSLRSAFMMLGLGARRGRDHAQPDRIARQQVGRDSAEHRVDRRVVLAG